MAVLKAEIKRGFLRCLYRPCTAATPIPFIGALEAFQTQGFNALKNGRLIVQAGGSGHSVAFKAPSAGFTEDEIFALSEEFITIYNDTVTSISAAGDGSDDDAIFNAMLQDDRLQRITSYSGDNLYARQPFVGTIGA